MNPEKVTEKELETFGKSIENSVYFRDFCSCCREPIRVPSEKLYNDNYCFDCNGHQRPGRTSALAHLQDYNGPDDAEGGFGISEFDYD
jgi:hypothetical protein